MSSIIHPQVPASIPPSLELESPKRRFFRLLCHHVPKFKINCAKYYGNENLCLRGIINGLNKFYMEVLEDSNRALYQDKNNYLALKWRAFCYYEIHLYNYAFWDLYLIINSDCSDAFTYLNQADTNRRLNKNCFESYKMSMDSASVLEDLNKLCILELENDYHYELRGAIFLDMQKWNDSLKKFQSSNQITPK
ncbi:hypothetical protein Glove_365g89 [Diversispora epigaea]|uniref:Uncharacterized protein n=1 Tax=Diversispora epigaea TaxID=1348612 RepID=A0A397HCY4_9GLOM|nr:hypothetical protein Glove_365g89 [Diversispora epigaea]